MTDRISLTSTKTGKVKESQYGFEYFLTRSGMRLRVCKQFFLSTLDIGDKFVRYTISKGVNIEDQRGKMPCNRHSDDDVLYVRSHIESFPTMDPHYVRKSSKRKYLESSLNITIMYELYKKKCELENRIPLKRSTYRNIFCEQYNLSFHVPKKDQFAKCKIFKDKVSPTDDEKKGK